jgi:hypothetical protein
MAFGNGPRIITDGLVLALDASDRNSYVSGSTTWNDMSGNANTGTLTNGPTFSTGSGGNIVFDGVDDYVSVPDNSLLRLVGECTICFWVKPTLLKNYGNLIWKANYPSNGYGLISLANGEVQLQISPANSNPSSGVGTLVNGEWCNLSITLNSSNSVIFYKNGNLKATATSAYSIISGTTSLRIAADTDNSRYFNGTISQVQIYNRALSATEILQNYNATKSRFNL